MNNITVRQAQESEIPILESILLDSVGWVSEVSEPLWNKEDVIWDKLSRDYQISDFYIAYINKACNANFNRGININIDAIPASCYTRVRPDFIK